MKDILTGLDQYEVFLQKLEKELEQIGDDRIIIVYTDIKHFKYINDTYGYKVGDALLQDFVEEFMGKTDIIICASRVYSDNFVVANRVPPDYYSNEEFRDLIHKLNQEREAKFRGKYLNSRLQFCTGISVIDKNSRSQDAETAVSNANLARKVAKEMEHDSCVLFDQSMMEGIRREVEITSSIPKALAQKEFQVYFQPKIDTETLELIGAEALVRWQKPDGSFVYPDEFIPLIERSGQVIDVDYFVYREVFSFLSRRLKEGKKVVPVSLNVSRVHLQKMHILEYVKELLALYNKYPAMYTIDNDWAGFEWLNADDADRSTYSFYRKDKTGKNNIMFVLNMTPMKWENYKIGVPKKKKYKLLLNSDDKRFGGNGNVIPAEIAAVKEPCNFKDYSISFDLPPYTAAVFIF